MSGTRMTNLDDLELDGGTQVRLAMDRDTVSHYAELYLNDTVLPPILVFYDGLKYWVVDGFHRVAAARQAKRSTIEADVRKGTQTEAQYEALKGNKHGLPLMAHDRARAVQRALRLHPEYSDRRIAADVGVSHNTVAKYRAAEGPTGQSDHSTRVSKDGKTRPAKQPKRIMTKEEYEAGEDAQERPLEVPTDPQPTTDPNDEQSAATGGMDCAGHVLPPHLVHSFNRREEIEKLMRQLSSVRAAVATAVEANDPLYSEMNVTAFDAEIARLHQRLSGCRPYSVCPNCTGDGCMTCKKRGWVTKATWMMSPADMKAQLEKQPCS